MRDARDGAIDVGAIHVAPQPVVRRHARSDGLQARRELVETRMEDGVRARREDIERHRIPARPVAGEQVVEIDVEDDAGVAAATVREPCTQRDDRGVRIGEAVDAPMQQDLASFDLAVPLEATRTEREIAEQRAQHGRVALPCEVHVREPVHRS